MVRSICFALRAATILLAAAASVRPAAAEDLRNWLLGMSFSSDSRKVAVCGEAVQIVDLASRKPLAADQSPAQDRKWFRAVAFSPRQPDLLAMVQGDSRVLLWQLGGEEPLAEFPEEKGIVSSLTFSPDGRQLLGTFTVSGPEGKRGSRMQLWDVATRKPLRSEERPGVSIHGVSFSGDGRRVALGVGSTVEVVEAATWEKVASASLPSGGLAGEPTGLATGFAADDKTVLVAGGICVPTTPEACNPMGLLWLWNLDEMTPETSHPTTMTISGFSLTPDRKACVLGYCIGTTHRVAMLKIEGGDVLWTKDIPLRNGSIHDLRGLQVSPDGKWVGWCNFDSVHILRRDDGEEAVTLTPENWR